MDPTEILNVRFHIGGELIRLGKEMQYVGGCSALPFAKGKTPVLLCYSLDQ
jgi:hypothetical protein